MERRTAILLSVRILESPKNSYTRSVPTHPERSDEHESTNGGANNPVTKMGDTD
jgi:hypothetical protein